MQYVGFGRRFVAVLLDGLIIGAAQYILGMVFSGGNYNFTTGTMTNANPIVTILSLAISIGYYVVYQAKMGQTLGKKVMGIKVVDLSGKTPNMVTFALREIIGKFVSAIIFCIGFLWVLWDPKKQALHDKIASTFVVKA